jgi:hypothetical protein
MKTYIIHTYLLSFIVKCTCGFSFILFVSRLNCFLFMQLRDLADMMVAGG